MKSLFVVTIIILGVLLLIGVDEATASFLTPSPVLVTVPSGSTLKVKYGCKLVQGKLVCGSKQKNKTKTDQGFCCRQLLFDAGGVVCARPCASTLAEAQQKLKNEEADPKYKGMGLPMCGPAADIGKC